MNSNDDASKNIDAAAQSGRMGRTLPLGMIQLALVAAVAVAAGLLVFPI